MCIMAQHMGTHRPSAGPRNQMLNAIEMRGCSREGACRMGTVCGR